MKSSGLTARFASMKGTGFSPYVKAYTYFGLQPLREMAAPGLIQAAKS
jgi:hypothetical protein